MADRMSEMGRTRRLAILAYIQDCALKGEHPSIVEIAGAVGLKSRAATHHHIRVLAKEGKLATPEHRRARGVALAEAGTPVVIVKVNGGPFPAELLAKPYGVAVEVRTPKATMNWTAEAVIEQGGK